MKPHCRFGRLPSRQFSIWLMLLLTIVRGAHAATPINVGYLPVLPMSQLFVVVGEGWAKSAGIELKLQRFTDASALMKAFAAGRLQVAYVGISPVLVARSKGIDVRVVASNVVEQVAFYAGGELSRYMLRDAASGITRFTARTGRRPRIGVLPKGSVPDTVLRHWLMKSAHLTLDNVEIVPLGADQLQSAVLAGTVDGAALLEPLLTLALTRNSTAKVVMNGVEMMPNMPGAVLAVAGTLTRSKPGIVQKFVDLHHRATEFLIRKPEIAAAHIQTALGGDYTLAIIERAITSPQVKFVSDPFRIVNSTKALYEFQRELGEFTTPVDLDALFETHYYRKLAGG